MNASEDDQVVKPNLGVAKTDWWVSGLKAASGIVPFGGSLIAEILGDVVPNQRLDRVANFAQILSDRLGLAEQAVADIRKRDEYFVDLIEEATRQAAQSLTDDRRRNIANLMANSLASETIDLIRSKHLLTLLGELNDIEVLWLLFYVGRRTERQNELRKLHPVVFAPISRRIANSQEERDQSAIRESYLEHLARLHLLEHDLRIDSKTHQPEYDSSGPGGLKSTGYSATSLGKLLVRFIDDPIP